MNYKKRMRLANQKLRRKAEEDRDENVFHSRAYHRFFEGYRETRVLDSKGRTKIVREYAGTWYVQDVSRVLYVGVRLLYVFLFVGILLLFAGAALTQGGSGSALYVVLPEIVSICFFFRLFYVLTVCYLFVPGKMTVDDYRTSSLALEKSSAWCAAALFAAGAGTGIYLLLHGDKTGTAVLAGLLFLAAAALSLLVSFVERKVPYRKVENSHPPMEDEMLILSDENLTA